MIQMHYFRRFCENSLYLLGDAVIHRRIREGFFSETTSHLPTP